MPGETIRVLEPADCDRAAIFEAIAQRRYDKPFVGDDAEGRTLYSSIGCVQSRMLHADPWALDLRYTRKAMSFLLFGPRPRRILLLGLGGGSIAKFCHRHLPSTQIDVVEVDPNVIAVRRHFLVPEDSSRFRVMRRDAAEYVGRATEAYDVIVTDAYDDTGISSGLCDREFYRRARARLAEEGMLVANLAGDTRSQRHHLALIDDAFGGRLLLVPVEGEGNEIVIAFKGIRPEERPWARVRRDAALLGSTLGLDFPRFAARLERSCKLRYAERVRAARVPAQAIAVLGVPRSRETLQPIRLSTALRIVNDKSQWIRAPAPRFPSK
jgi:spermidine synthase